MENKLHDTRCIEIANLLGIDVIDVKRAVSSFFAAIRTRAKKLPFDNRRRIYTPESFSRLVVTHNIPFIGRIGPIYSRYIKWRSNEMKGEDTALRSSYRVRMKQSELETMAADILAGKTPSIVPKRKKSDLYDSIWIVDKDGKKLARQVIKKD